VRSHLVSLNWVGSPGRCASAGLLALVVLLVTSCGSKPPAAVAGARPASAAPGPGAAVAPVPPTNQFAAVFIDEPGVGCDPFFPQSARRAPRPKAAAGSGAAAASVAAEVVDRFQLKAIGGTASRRLATINRVTLLVGESGRVRFVGGEATVQLLEVRDDSVVVLVDEERQELAFRNRRLAGR